MQTTTIRNSSNVAKVEYDPDAKQLHVHYHHGGVYRYHDVSQQQHDDLVNAPSVGAHLHANIKPFHRTERVR